MTDANSSPALAIAGPPLILALCIADAARAVGLSRGQFYRVYLNPKRVTAIATGRRDRVVDVAELRKAYEAYVAEQRALGAGADGGGAA